MRKEFTVETRGPIINRLKSLVAELEELDRQAQPAAPAPISPPATVPEVSVPVTTPSDANTAVSGVGQSSDKSEEPAPAD